MDIKNNENKKQLRKQLRKQMRRSILKDCTHLYLLIIWPMLGITILASSGTKTLVTVSPFLALGLFFGIVNMLYYGHRKD